MLSVDKYKNTYIKVTNHINNELTSTGLVVIYNWLKYIMAYEGEKVKPHIYINFVVVIISSSHS